MGRSRNIEYMLSGRPSMRIDPSPEGEGPQCAGMIRKRLRLKAKGFREQRDGFIKTTQQVLLIEAGFKADGEVV